MCRVIDRSLAEVGWGVETQAAETAVEAYARNRDREMPEADQTGVGAIVAKGVPSTRKGSERRALLEKCHGPKG